MLGKLVFGLIMQVFTFYPFFLIWVKDCKEIGKENLAVSLKERFITWCIYFPIWLFILIYY
jgi:hypothetical protein